MVNFSKRVEGEGTPVSDNRFSETSDLVNKKNENIYSSRLKQKSEPHVSSSRINCVWIFFVDLLLLCARVHPRIITVDHVITCYVNDNYVFFLLVFYPLNSRPPPIHRRPGNIYSVRPVVYDLNNFFTQSVLVGDNQKHPDA